jgi:hypothetical protein
VQDEGNKESNLTYGYRFLKEDIQRSEMEQVDAHEGSGLLSYQLYHGVEKILEGRRGE